MPQGINLEIADRATEATETRNETVGHAFTINVHLAQAADAPGPAWLDAYDYELLRVQECGYSNDFAGNQFFWCTFVPTRVGTATVTFAKQPRLINPLFISIPYTIVISE